MSPLPEVNVANLNLWGSDFGMLVASGLTQPTIIRLRTSRRLRTRVNVNIPRLDRTVVCGTLSRVLLFSENKDI